MFSRLIDLSKDTVEPEALWLVVSGQTYPNNNQSAWTALVSAISYPEIGEFIFDFDSRIAPLGDSISLRYRDNDLNRMITVPATIISRADDPTNELSKVRVIVDKCCCGASSCQTATCFEAGTFISQRDQLRAAA